MNKVYLALLTVIILLAVTLGVVLSQPKSDNLPLTDATPTPTPSPTTNPTLSPTVVPTLDVTAEQVSITNVAFTDATHIQILVQNAGGTQGTINSAFINGVATPVFDPVGVAKSSQTIITFTSPDNGTFTLTPGTSYTVKLITAKGTSIVSSATTYSP